MYDILLFTFFIILPFFRVFQEVVLQNIHNIIASAAVLSVVMGLLAGRLNDYIDRTIRYMLPVLISAIAVHFFLKTYDSAQIKITLLESGGPMLLALWVIKCINNGGLNMIRSRRYAFYPAILFLLSGLISFLFSPFKLETFEPGILRRLSYMGVFIVTALEFNRERDFKRIINWILATCVLVVLYGFIQYFNMDWHIWKGAFGRKIFSTFGNPNFYAAWLVLVLPLIMTKILLTGKSERFAYAVLAVGVFFNILVTGTKGSWVGLAIGISVFVVMATLYLIKGDPRVLKKIVAVILIVIIAVTSVGVTWFSIKRLSSIRFRLFTWGAAMKMISEPVFASPVKAFLIGQGIESFKLVYPAYRRPEIFHIEGKHNTETDHAHNEFLEVFYDEGIVGLVIFLWLLGSIYYAALRRLSLIGMGRSVSSDEFYMVGLIAGTLGMLAHASVSVHVRFVSSGYILWTLMGLIVVQTAPFRKDAISQKKRSMPDMIKIPLIFLVLAAAGFNSFLAARRFIANIYHNKAIAYSKQRAWPKALYFYKKVQKYHPSFIMGYYFEGNVYNDKLSEAIQAKDKKAVQENYRKAIDTYRKVRSMYPNYVQVHFQEGMLHLKVGNVEEAVKSFRRYMNIVDPVFPPTYFRMGMIRARQGDLDGAEWYLQEPIRRKPKLMDGYLNLGNLYTVRQKYKKAEQIYLKALKVKPEELSVMASLGGLYERWGRRKEALRIYRDMLRIRPNDQNLKNKINSLKS